MQGEASGSHTIMTQENIMLMDGNFCGDKEGKGSDIRVPLQQTMEPFVPSAKRLALNCSEAQAL
jgi:hypothetical protein